ncbi:hypothetical protein PQO03_18665 [Lentisphaera profundi]|uniref:Restriction endonuclease type IV Mrr domain-containing protein n=1 Tax=Lentisphaera profundi TaxID=1658616 RepID=A0ABY7VUF6_9BACT|nr:hypothetical protein [Lentisphaera profundi]WDE97851.1 hypothetical protein PQO03_18665 [Lentisphaera profundi]
MKLEKILNNLNSLEKNSFIKVIDGIIGAKPKNIKAIDKLISDTDKSGLKGLDNVVISKIFSLVEDEFLQKINSEFVNIASQLDILIDIIIRDGNCIMKQDWFARLYEKELKTLSLKIKELEADIENPKSDLSDIRKRDYSIYKACIFTAFNNDLASNREAKITDDELSILLTLAKEMEFTQSEVRLMNYNVLPPQKAEIDEVLAELKNLGIIFISKKTSTIYIADEMVKLLRCVREKEIADKFFRRVLRSIKEPQINAVCRRHNINTKSLDHEAKIRSVIEEGISFSSFLSEEIHKEGSNLTSKKKTINDLWSVNLKYDTPLKGVTLEEKIYNIILHFEQVERDDKVGISIDGYEQLLTDLGDFLPKLNLAVKNEFELQEEVVLKSDLLLDYNIKPRDILDLINGVELQAFCKDRELKVRGDNIQNILDGYKDSENLYLENYANIGFRNLNELKENGIVIKEAELGIKFEDLTKSIFEQLGFNVDEVLKKELNTKKDKIDILLNLGNNELILVECKTIKESGYNKFSAVSRQMQSYTKLAEGMDCKIIKSLLVAPDFSEDFVEETAEEYELNLSLITAESLLKILEAFKSTTKHKTFPYKLLLRDVLIQEDRIIKAIGK